MYVTMFWKLYIWAHAKFVGKLRKNFRDCYSDITQLLTVLSNFAVKFHIHSFFFLGLQSAGHIRPCSGFALCGIIICDPISQKKAYSRKIHVLA